MLQGISYRLVIQGVSGKDFVRDWNAGIIQKQSHLNDRLPAIFFAYPIFSGAFFDDISVFIYDVIVGFVNLKVEIGDIVIDDVCISFEFS